ncbi:methionyl-tRNA formyltransferase [Alphaproteobacteria bacterium]|nr:methionyl-tRNA formyltransferase [Alphaproteobacteria bacterium]
MRQERIIFMGTPEISKVYLQSLIEYKYNIIAAYTQPPRKKGRGLQIQKSPVHKLSLKHNIPVYYPNNFASLDTIDEFKKLNSDIAIVMGYGILLPKGIIEAPIHGSINIHVSLLPRWRGAAPIEHALLNGDKVTGVSIFQLKEKLDAGPIIAKQKIDIDANICKEDLTIQLNTMGTSLLNKILPDFFDKKIILQKQNENKATYAKKITSKHRKINFNNDVKIIYNQIRSFAPKPSAWFVLNNERINIIKCSIKICDAEVSTIMNDQFHIGCRNGKIIPQIIQRQGKKPMEISEFLKGFTFKIGQKINA